MEYTVEPMGSVGRQEWDSFVDTHPNSYIYHKFGMLNTSNLLPGIKNISFCVLDKEDIVCEVPLIVDTSKHSLIQKIFPVKLGSLHSNGILFNSNSSEAHLQNIIFETLNEYGVKYRACELTYRSLPDHIISKSHDPILKPFRKLDGYLRIINLQKPVDYLWRSMEKRGRNSIRYALKNKVELYEVPFDTTECVDIMYKLYTNTIRRNKQFTKDWFKSIARESENSLVIVAYYKNDPIAISVASNRGYFADHWIRYTNATGLKYRANALMQWHTIKRLKEDGIRYYIIGEVLHNAGMDGRIKFEKSFGGDIYEGEQYRLTLDPEWVLLKDLLSTFKTVRSRRQV